MDAIFRNTTYPRKMAVEEFDFFSEGISISVGGEDRIRSKTGAFMSILIYIILGFSSWYYIAQFLDTTNPKIQYSLQKSNDLLTFDLNDMGSFFFVLVSNPESTETMLSADKQPTNPDEGLKYNVSQLYLNASTLGRLYSHKASVISTTYTVPEPGSTTTTVNETITDVQMIPCKYSDWVNSDEFLDILRSDDYMYQILINFAFCFNTTDGLEVKGDIMSSSSSVFEYTMEICKVDPKAPLCSQQATTIVSSKDNTYVTIGSFTPSVNNELKVNPWEYRLGIVSESRVHPVATSTTTALLKTLQVETDFGLIIEDTEEDSRGVVYQNYRDTKSIIYPVSPNLRSPDFAVQYSLAVNQNQPIFKFRIVGTRVVENFSRSYTTILDLLGNIGGSIDFILLFIVILYNWYENLNTTNKLRVKIAHHLSLPKKMRPKFDTIFDACKKDKSKDDVIEAIDGVSDDALSLERIATHGIICSQIKNHLFPEELNVLAPVVFVLFRLNEKLEAKSHAARDKESSMTLVQAYQAIKDQERTNSGDPFYKATRKLFIKEIERYCERHGVLPEEYLDDAYGTKSKMSIISGNILQSNKQADADPAVVPDTPPGGTAGQDNLPSPSPIPVSSSRLSKSNYRPVEVDEIPADPEPRTKEGAAQRQASSIKDSKIPISKPFKGPKAAVSLPGDIKIDNPPPVKRDNSDDIE
jgi:hypothetical protein